MSLPLWLSWLAAFLGFPLGGTLAQLVAGPVSSQKGAILGGLSAGLVIGLAQWLGLRKTLPLGASWILCTALGLGAGLSLGYALMGKGTSYSELAARGAIAGGAVGLAQWAALRGTVSGPASLAWIPAVAAAWSAGWCVTKAVGVDLSRDYAVYGASGAIVFQGLTGLVIVLIK